MKRCEKNLFGNLRAYLFVLSLVFASFTIVVATATNRNDLRHEGASESPVADSWHSAPPAPTILESDRVAELAARRRAVMKRIGEKGILVLLSAEPRVYANDVDYPYRQENNLYYLTGIKQPGVSLVLIPGARKTREILYVPPRDPSRETWTGHMLSVEEARARSGIAETREESSPHSLLALLAPRAATALRRDGARADEKRPGEWRDDFGPVLEAIAKNEGELYLLLPHERDSREYRWEQAFASSISSIATGLAVKSATPIFDDLRLRKSPWEVRLVQHAVDISAEAFHRSFALAAPGVYEYEIQAEFEYTFRRRHADNWGYPCIVGAGGNTTTLHYITSQDRVDTNDLLLMDCAAEFDHYTADITRTIPINGRFTMEQAEIYRIVYQAQLEAIRRVRAGNRLGGRREAKLDSATVHGRAVEVVKEGLLRIGLITSKDNDEYRTWFMHGTSHWLGMNVHDVGDTTTPLEPGMVLTVEPGIYLRPDALDVLPKTPQNERFIAAVRTAFDKYKGIGVRIEDDVLVTAGEPKVLSAAIPSGLEEVEDTLARLKMERRRSGLPSIKTEP